MKRLIGLVLAFSVVFATVGIMASLAAPFTTPPMIAATGDHTVALKADGTVWIWGYDTTSDFVYDSPEPRIPPQQVEGLSNVVSIAAGLWHTVALKADGTVWTFGSNLCGQLGDGTVGRKTSRNTPAQVSVLSEITAIAAGSGHTVALKKDGTVWAWGENSSGQLGEEPEASTELTEAGEKCRSTPGQVLGLSDVTAIAAGERTTYALKKDGTVWGWGNRYDGQLGDGAIEGELGTYRAAPGQIPGLTDVVTIVTNGGNTFATKKDGTVWAWGGYNTYGQLGDGTIYSGTGIQIARSTVAQIPSLSAMSKLVAGDGGHTVGVKADGTVWTWGRNFDGQLGDGKSGDGKDRATPGQVLGLTDVVAAAAGTSHTVVLKADGTLWAWGKYMYGQLGTKEPSITPAQVVGKNGEGWLNLNADKNNTITFDSMGGSAVVSQSVGIGEKTTKPADPAMDGYTFLGWYSDSECTRAYDFNTGVTESITLYAKWKEGVDPGWQNPFGDVSKSDWFYDDVKYVVENGIFAGMGTDTFNPNAPVTRGMLATVLWRMDGSPKVEGTPFTDVAVGNYYADGIAWAAANRIVGGVGDGKFAPNTPITRQDMAVMLENYLQYREVQYGINSIHLYFADEDDIAEYAKLPVQILYKLNILGGKGEDIIDPLGRATRGEAAAMLHRLHEKYIK